MRQYVQEKKNLIILRDWNTVVGEHPVQNITEKYGLGSENERSQRLIDFCRENQLVIANTVFQHHPSRPLYMEKSMRHNTLSD